MSEPVLSSYRFVILDISDPFTPDEVFPSDKIKEQLIKLEFEKDLEEVRRMLDGE